MAWPFNWYITSAVETWVGNTRHCVYTTDTASHLYMVVSTVARYLRIRWLWFRGTARQHGYSWRFTADYTIEQQEPGDTLIHTFDIPDWNYCNVRYWYMWGTLRGYLLHSNSPFFEAHYQGAPAPPLPVPTPIPVSWPLVGPCLRCGNRYSFWINGFWYIMIPTATCLTMWRLITGNMFRLDQAHEPVPSGGTWVDADARATPTRPDIAVAAFFKPTTGLTRQLWYVLFDTTTCTWGVPNFITSPLFVSGASQGVSLTLDASADPSFWYTHYASSRGQIHVIIYNAGIPDPPFAALSSSGQILGPPTSYQDPVGGTRAVAAVSNVYRLHARSRSSAGVWSAQNVFADLAVNLPHNSISANDGHLDLATPGRYLALNYHRYIPPWANFPGLVPATNQYANSITNEGAPNQLLIVYKGNDTKLWYLWRDPALVWHPPQGFDIFVGANLAATHAEPDVTSCVWQGPGLNTVTFFAFYDPWTA